VALIERLHELTVAEDEQAEREAGERFRDRRFLDVNMDKKQAKAGCLLVREKWNELPDHERTHKNVMRALVAKVPLSIKKTPLLTYRDWLTRLLDEQASAARKGSSAMLNAMHVTTIDYAELTRLIADRIGREPGNGGNAHVTLKDGTKAKCHQCGSLECPGINQCEAKGKNGCTIRGCTCFYLEWCLSHYPADKGPPKREKIPSASDPKVNMQQGAYDRCIKAREGWIKMWPNEGGRRRRCSC
jgi:hypothetical protein